MAFSSSPIVYPPSSSPEIPAFLKKRPAPEEQQAPKQKKRLFGAARWDAANIPVIPTSEDKSTAQEPSKSERTVDVALPEVGTVTIPSAEARSRPVFIEPPYRAEAACNQPHPIDTLRSDAFKPTWSFSRADEPAELLRSRTCSGKQFVLCRRKPREAKTFERTIAERSTTTAGRATTSYYGINIHGLIEEANTLNVEPAPEPEPTRVVPTIEEGKQRRSKHAMWTEKYRARKFIDLVGDERTHRSVLRWLKGWDSIVFPGAAKPVVKSRAQDEDDEPHQRKILVLTGPPGLGKTTLAHVCAKQAGYEVVEINASDERSRDVVRGRIRDCVGTENVRGVNSQVGETVVRKAGKPVCVVVDEVDGVVSGSGGSGDGGFMKALVDLVQLDQRNSKGGDEASAKKKGDKFRLLRPMILICNDLYHPSLRALRSSNLAEIVHVRKPALDKVVARLKTVFEREGIPADMDGVRRLCEATWGVSRKKDDAGSQSTGDGDLRSVLVVGEWAARKLRATSPPSTSPRLSRAWVEQHMLADLASGNSARGLGRGGSWEMAERVFLENAGFSRSATASSVSGSTGASGSTFGSSMASISAATRANAMALLRAAIETTGEVDRIMTDVFTAYPSRPFQDDTFLSKPNAASEWLHFHDKLSNRVFASQEWELAPYLPMPVLGFHHLFGSTNQFNAQHHSSAAHNHSSNADEIESPFTGPRADFEAGEVQKQNRASLQTWHGTLSMELFRSFRSPEHLATDLAPYVAKLVSPNVSPVMINSSAQGSRGASTASVRREGEKDMVRRAAGVMLACGVAFDRVRVEDHAIGNVNVGGGGWILRMEPSIDELSTFSTTSTTSFTSSEAAGGATAGTRFSVRQVLAQAHAQAQAAQQAAARAARFNAGGSGSGSGPSVSAQAAAAPLSSAVALGDVSKGAEKVRRDFFGRVIASSAPASGGSSGDASSGMGPGKARIWVSFHEGFSNAVRKPVSLAEIMGML